MTENTSSLSLEQIESLLASANELSVQNNELLLRLYAVSLFAVGVTGACFVSILLYKFLKSFF